MSEAEAKAIARGAGKWGRSDFPHTGWTAERTEYRSAVCEMCERQHIRYVHVMRHPEVATPLACGNVCASRMSEDPEGTDHRETTLRADRKRHNQFFNGAWIRKGRSAEETRTSGYLVSVYYSDFEDHEGWRASVEKAADRSYLGPFRTSDEAKQAAWDCVNRLRAAS